MKANSKLIIISTAASLVVGGTVANAAPKRIVPHGNARQTSKNRERSERGRANEHDERDEAGEAGEGQASLKPKISMSKARAIALEYAPGKVESEKLERAGGHLVYSFDIRNADDTITKVQLDAISGKILRAKRVNKKK
jgi:uncharacterized membrane protein YkoI